MRLESPTAFNVLFFTVFALFGPSPAGFCEDTAKARMSKVLTNKSAKPNSKEQLKRIERGKALFLANQCLDCHLVAGKGCDEGFVLDDISKRRTTEFVREHLNDPEQHVARNAKAFEGNPNLMPAPNLSKAEINDVVAYLMSLPPQKPQSVQHNKRR